MSKPTREEIQRRRAAVAETFTHARREFNYLTARAQVNLMYVQAECEHPEAAKQSKYVGSHFEQRCTDCGKLLT